MAVLVLPVLLVASLLTALEAQFEFLATPLTLHLLKTLV
jgi:hypothetical protein